MVNGLVSCSSLSTLPRDPIFFLAITISAKFSVRPGADQSSKAAFGKSALAKTCFLLLKIRLAHIKSKKQKCFRARFGTFLPESILLIARAKTCSKVLLLFARLVCASQIFNKRSHVRACFSKSAFAKSSFARLVCARP